MSERTSVGLDVHARSVVACAIDGETGLLTRARLCPDYGEVHRWLLDLEGPLRVVYEAGPTGFGLSRFLASVGIDCVVAAPSKLVRASGDRVKTDARDALHLARLLRLGEVTAVAVPSIGQEAARDLVRAREDARGDLMRNRHRVSKLLLRQGIVYYGGTPWTGKHLTWLRSHRFDAAGLQVAYDSAVEAMLLTTDRRGRLDAAITAMAAESEFTAVVDRLCCLRGISSLTGFGLTPPEVGDWHRFTGSTIGAFLGLVPTELSPPQGRHVRKDRSPRPATPTPAGYWSRPPGITSATTAPPVRRCAPAGTRPLPRRGFAAIRATSACTPAGRCSGPARSAPWWPTSRSPASSPAGAGRWPSSTRALSRASPQMSGRCTGMVAARGTNPRFNYGQPPHGGHARSLDQRKRSSRIARPAVTNPRISV